MISSNCSSGVVTLKAVARYKCIPLPTIVAVSPVSGILSIAFFIPERIPSDVTVSAALAEVDSGLIKPTFALAVIDI